MEFIPLSYYTLSGILNFITSFALLIFVFSKNPKSYVAQTFSLFAFTVAGWAFFYVLWLTAGNQYLAEFHLRTLMIFVIFIPSTFTHFILTFVKVEFNKKLTLTNYLISLFLGLMVYTPIFAKEISPYLVFPYWLRTGPLFHLHTIHFFINVVYAHFLMLRAIKHHSGIFRSQILYVFIGTAMGFMSGILNYFTWYRLLSIPPFLNPLVSIYVASVAYAIIKYRLMDIRIAVTRAGIFILVYTLVLGIPFWIGAKLLGLGLWLIPTGICAVLATLGPTIYLYLQRKAEYKILQKEKDAHNLLRQASAGMLEIHDSQKILNFIVDLVIKILHFKTASVYLWDGNDNQYISRASSLSPENKIAINPDDVLVEYLKEKSSPLVYEEIKMMVREGEDSPLRCIMARMEALSAHAIIPIYKNGLLGFLALGERYEHSIFDQDLLGVLIVLSNQAALAIENAMYYEESQKDWVERARDSRLKTMGSMGTGIAHQIRNRLNAISAQCMLLEDLQDSFDPAKATPEDFYQLRDGCKKVLGQILKSIGQGEEIVDAIKNYAKRTEATPQVVPFEQTISGAMHLLKLSRKEVAFTLKENYPQELKLWTNFSMLQDMLYNMLDNSNDAIISKREEIQGGRLAARSEEFRISLNASVNGKMCEISLEDNGMGIKKEHLEEDKGVNVMYFTTKGATKGTGMGLALMRQFIRYNGGTMKVESEYAQWTRIIFTLPLATKEQIEKFQDNNGQDGL